MSAGGFQRPSSRSTKRHTKAAKSLPWNRRFDRRDVRGSSAPSAGPGGKAAVRRRGHRSRRRRERLPGGRPPEIVRVGARSVGVGGEHRRRGERGQVRPRRACRHRWDPASQQCERRLSARCWPTVLDPIFFRCGFSRSVVFPPRVARIGPGSLPLHSAADSVSSRAQARPSRGPVLASRRPCAVGEPPAGAPRGEMSGELGRLPLAPSDRGQVSRARN